MENLNKKSVNKGVKSMTAKAMSWSQVCKQLSGMGGYVEVGEGEKVRPLVMMQSLGVNVSKNSYKVTDIFAAWSERIKAAGTCLIHLQRHFHIVHKKVPFKIINDTVICIRHLGLYRYIWISNSTLDNVL